MFAFAIGLATRATDGRALEVFYPRPLADPAPELVTALTGVLGAPASGGDEANFATELDDATLEAAARAFDDAGAADLASTARACLSAQKATIATLLYTDGPLMGAEDAYLKLHLLSHRMRAPNSMNLDGIFTIMPNVAWTSDGAIAPEELQTRQLRARAAGRTLTVHALDKFPRMLDYVSPSGVRISDASRVRLGAHLGEGTTCMPEAQVNFNSGTLGTAMIEGRISQGVVLGDHSDLGGGASTQGTLSGGGKEKVSVGEHCLIGANAGTGISLGDRCTIEAGLYITAGTVVTVLDENREVVGQMKARELSGRSDMLFIRNSTTGVIECRTNRSVIELNADLHSHN